MNNLAGLRTCIDDQYRNFTEQFTGDGASTVFDLSHFPVLSGTALSVKVTGATQTDGAHFTLSYDDGRMAFATAPSAGGVVSVAGKRSVFSDTELVQVLTDHSLATGSAMTSLAGLDGPVLTCIDLLFASTWKRHTWAAAGGQSVSEGQLIDNLEKWKKRIVDKQRGEESGPQGNFVPWADSQGDYSDPFSG